MYGVVLEKKQRCVKTQCNAWSRTQRFDIDLTELFFTYLNESDFVSNL